MVNIHDKAITHRLALAQGRIQMQPETLHLVESVTAQKGDVLGIARIAAIMAAKRTSDILPLCHPLALTHITIDFEISKDNASVFCTARVETDGKTGVEMEALTAVQVALLTIYDMLKAVDRGMIMTDICLLEKAGGQSGTWQRP